MSELKEILNSFSDIIQTGQAPTLTSQARTHEQDMALLKKYAPILYFGSLVSCGVINYNRNNNL